MKIKPLEWVKETDRVTKQQRIIAEFGKVDDIIFSFDIQRSVRVKSTWALHLINSASCHDTLISRCQTQQQAKQMAQIYVERFVKHVIQNFVIEE